MERKTGSWPGYRFARKKKGELVRGLGCSIQAVIRLERVTAGSVRLPQNNLVAGQRTYTFYMLL